MSAHLLHTCTHILHTRTHLPHTRTHLLHTCTHILHTRTHLLHTHKHIERESVTETHTHTHTEITQIQCPPQLLAPLVNMSKTGYKKICLCCLSSWSFTQNIHKNLTFSLK